MTARWITADVYDGLATLEDGSVDLVVTSPPFLALRSYLPADHPDKAKEIGSEATPAEFIDTLLAVTAELRRVLAPHGSICVELGDTYAGSGGAGGDYNQGGWRHGQDVWDGSSKREEASNHKYAGEWANPGYGDGFKGGNPGGTGWPLAKSRALIPQLYEIALAYGINPLTGHPSPAGQWRIRNVVTWARPNPPVGALGDKWRPATSDLIVACTSSKRYWDDLATRKAWRRDYNQEENRTRSQNNRGAPGNHTDGDESITKLNTAGAPLLDYWEIPPGGFSGAHYAVFPPELVVPCVKAMCPSKVCRVCGEPSRRVHEHLGRDRFNPDLSVAEFAERLRAAMNRSGLDRDAVAEHLDVTPRMISFYLDEPAGTGRLPSVPQWALLQRTVQWTKEDLRRLDLMLREYETEDRGNRNIPERLSGGPLNGDKPKVVATGWTDCGHDDYRPGLVLDPFAGSGTTLAVATGHGHNAIGIDLDPRNAELARDRIGPFLFEEVTV